ncbi:MAG: winged helix-turn-helix domain-containing protein [Gammaproteobacteria bacterium]|nr:winged helix-turn-helix domain-containing protein [Gammaproteobacteria bacterium]
MSTMQTLQLRFDAFELNEGNARLTRNGLPVALAPKAFDVLCTLLRHPGQLVTKDDLLNAVWGHQHVSESVLKTVISELRAALADDARQPRYIETVARRGYRFVGGTTQPPPAASNIRGEPASLQPVDLHVQNLSAPPIIGRQLELSQLLAAWNHAITGRRQIVWLAGEAGVGKTTLLDNFAAGLGPVRRAHGQCVEQFGAGEPYLPVLEALAALCRNDPALVSMMRNVAPTWLLQLPWLSNDSEREALRRELLGASQDRMLRELGELLDRYTDQQPLLLITEDLHWSDQATVHLINHIARRRAPARLMWLASFRLAEVISEDHPLKGLRHELRMHRLCDEIVLDPFSEQDVADYIGGRYPGREVSEAFVRALHARTDGLPLFVVNVIDDLVSQGLLQPEAQKLRADAAIMPLQVPENLAGVIEKQIARLAPEQRALLEAASVCGVEFRPQPVADALKREAGWVAERCDELTRQQHWLSSAAAGRLHDGALDARYSFRHALYRHVFYQRLGALARAQLHGQVAVALERSRAAGVAVTAAELASHFELSHELMAALRYYAEAAENALRHFAPREALDLTAHALELLPRAPAGGARDGLELALSAMRAVAAAQLLGVSALETKRAFERARTLLEAFPQHPLRAMVLHGLGLVLFVRGEYAQTRALGEHLLALSKAHSNGILFMCACNLLGQVSVLEGKNHEAVDWMEQGIAQCNAIGEEALYAAFLIDPSVTMFGASTVPLLHLGRINEARARLDAAWEMASRLRHPMSQMVVNWFGALLEIRLRDAARVGARAAALRKIVDEAALAQGEGPSQWFRGWADAHHGNPRDGFQRIRAAYTHNTGLGMYSGAAEVLSYGAEALALAGDWPEAQAQLDEAMQLAEQLGERVYLTQMLVLQGRIAHAQGDAGSARAAMQDALREARAQCSVWMELTALAALCELDNPTAEDLDALSEACAGLSEGLDTPLVVRAQELLRRHVG